MNIKIGTDICSIERIKDSYARFGQRFLERILTQDEQRYVLSSDKQLPQRLAARFAAKEAASKVLGVGWRGIGWKEVEVTKMPSGAPGLRLHGRARALSQKLGLTTFEVTLSHEKEYAIAFVLGMGTQEN